MRRREFLTGGAAGAASSLWPLAASAQQPATSRIGVVMAFKESDPVAQSLVAACANSATLVYRRRRSNRQWPGYELRAADRQCHRLRH